jgi:hypothetical protein
MQIALGHETKKEILKKNISKLSGKKRYYYFFRHYRFVFAFVQLDKVSPFFAF